MAQIEIYTKATCPFCHGAKEKLKEWKLNYTEHSVDDPKARQELISKYDHPTVPVIVIGGKFIGGFDDLIDAKASGTLDELLKEKD